MNINKILKNKNEKKSTHPTGEQAFPVIMIKGCKKLLEVHIKII